MDNKKTMQIFAPVVISWVKGLKEEIEKEGLIATADEIIERMEKEKKYLQNKL